MALGDCPFRLYLTPVQAAVCVGRVLCEKPDNAADASGGDVIRGERAHYGDAAHRAGSLRPRREWPRCRRSAEKPDELAAIHVPPSIRALQW
jgi:hypothetical protein